VVFRDGDDDDDNDKEKTGSNRFPLFSFLNEWREEFSTHPPSVAATHNLLGKEECE